MKFLLLQTVYQNEHLINKEYTNVFLLILSVSKPDLHKQLFLNLNFYLKCLLIVFFYLKLIGIILKSESLSYEERKFVKTAKSKIEDATTGCEMKLQCSQETYQKG